MPPRPSLRDLDFPPGYDSSEDLLERFYVPVLSRATTYDRSAGYFRSSVLAAAAKGVSRFVHGGGTMRLLVGVHVTEADQDALTGAKELDEAFAAKLAAELVPADELSRRRLEVLAWLVREGRLEVRVAIAVDDDGVPIVTTGEAIPYFHEKIGILRDAAGDGVAFQGSVNETITGWRRNFESFSVYTTWDGSSGHFDHWAARFEERWAGQVRHFRVYDLPEAVRRELLDRAPAIMPDERDPEEPPPVADDATVARYLLAAPRLINAAGLAEATCGVRPFPHQRQVVERLAGQYPRSWLVADEVGLGKTISAGMALRRLLLSGEVRRALILAPANVCRQWQDELFEKFGLWVPRLEGRQVHGAHPDDPTRIKQGENPFQRFPLLIASSHLARRPEQRDLVLAAAPYDLLVVDEAHHARRESFSDLNDYRPNRMLELLDRVTQARAARATWLLTATPMQVHPIELRDLLRQVGLSGPLAAPSSFLRYFAEISKDDDGKTAWRWLDRAQRESEWPPAGPDSEAVLSGVAARLNVVQQARVKRFGTGMDDPEQLVAELGPNGRRELRAWLRHQSPVGQYVTRHSRETLKRYRQLGLLHERLADRDVQSAVIQFTADEQSLYDRLDDLLDRLTPASATGARSQTAGFVLNVYRRRLTSSWAAIRRTLESRLTRDRSLLGTDVETLEDLGVVDLDLEDVDEERAVPVRQDGLAELRAFVDELSRVNDSKLDRLQDDINDARAAGHSIIVFTQFTATLEYLRDRLAGVYRSQLATFTGDGAREYREGEGWVPIAKRDLIEAVRTHRIRVLLANDAASEGLNLQACSFLINYDMPWNPMKVEQRIGRIDRLGQERDEVHVRSYFIPGTVEENVYAALASRIDVFRELLGALQPILGATERAFNQIFRQPRSERAAAQRQAIDELTRRIDELRRSGLELSTEDPTPVPAPPPAPVTLDQLRDLAAQRLGLVIDTPGRRATFDPSRASRDPNAWVALATYGHPVLAERLNELAAQATAGSALVIEGPAEGPLAAVRADTTPAEVLASVEQIDTLGTPVSTGEAETLAQGLAVEAAARRRSWHERIEAPDRTRQQQAIRQEFVRLVRDTIGAEIELARSLRGDELEPRLVWHSLCDDVDTGWSYAEPFRSRLAIPLPRLLDGMPPPSGKPIAVLRTWRVDSSHRLRGLIQQWVAATSRA